MSVADSESLRFWSFVYSIAEWAVIIGVVLEGTDFFSRRLSWRFIRSGKDLTEPWYSSPTKAESKWVHIFGDFGFWILIVGLVFGQISHVKLEGITNKENRRLTSQLDTTTKSASTNELIAKQLEIQLTEAKTQLVKAQADLIDLQNVNLPMDIGSQPNFAVMLIEEPTETPIKDLRKTLVKLRTLANDKSHKTADDLEIAFNFFGNWPLMDRTDIGEIGQAGIIIGYRYGDDLSEKAAKRLMRALTAQKVPSKIMTSDPDLLFEGIPTNGIIVVVCNRPDSLHEKLMLVQAKKAELDNDIPEILYGKGKLSDLEGQKFSNSSELKKAQAEHDKLAAQYFKMLKEKKALDESEKQIKATLDNIAFGTNSTFKIDGLMRFDPRTGSFGEKVVK